MRIPTIITVLCVATSAAGPALGNSCENGSRGADPVTFLFDCIKKNNDGVANKQSGFGAKVVAGATGIDVEAIPQTGLNGGHNSEVNKLCNGVTGPFGGHCN